MWGIDTGRTVSELGWSAVSLDGSEEQAVAASATPGHGEHRRGGATTDTSGNGAVAEPASKAPKAAQQER